MPSPPDTHTTVPVRPKYILILALSAAAILIIGSLVRPAPNPASGTQAPIPDTELARLAQVGQRRSIETQTAYLATLASNVAPGLVRVPDLETTGLVWSSGLVATARTRPRVSDGVTVTTAGGDLRADSIAQSPHLPLAGLRVTTTPELSVVTPATGLPQPGDWTLVVWRTDDQRAFAPATFIGTTPTTCGLAPALEVVTTLTATRAMAGGGLFDLDGGLLGMVLPCDDRLAVIATQSVQVMLDGAQTLTARLLDRYGLFAESPSPEESAHLHATTGVLVREVWQGSIAARAGLTPGDVIEAIDGTAVGTPDDLAPLANEAHEAPFALTVQRGTTRTSVPLPPHAAAAEPVPATTGLVLDTVAEGLLIDAVVAGSPAARAGIRPGDRLLRIDRREPRSRADAARLLSAGPASPVFVELQRGARRWGALLS